MPLEQIRFRRLRPLRDRRRSGAEARASLPFETATEPFWSVQLSRAEAAGMKKRRRENGLREKPRGAAVEEILPVRLWGTLKRSPQSAPVNGDTRALL